jgi:TPR repeat protein
LTGAVRPFDPQAGLRLLRLAAARDHVEAANRLGHVLLEGRLADKDALAAARLFTKAADAGHPPSMVDLGLMYANGNGMQADFAPGWHVVQAGRRPRQHARHG